MTKMMCTMCKYTIETETPPGRCPSCGNACTFVDATCYTPECGFDDNINTDIYKNRD